MQLNAMVDGALGWQGGGQVRGDEITVLAQKLGEHGELCRGSSGGIEHEVLGRVFRESAHRSGEIADPPLLEVAPNLIIREIAGCQALGWAATVVEK